MGNPKESITESQLKLLRSEEKFRLLFELSPVGMAMVDHETGEFLEVNNSILESTGYTKEEFLKLSYWDITPKKYEKQELQQIKDLNKTGRFGPNEKEFIRKDGSRFPIKISGFSLTNIDGRKVVWGIIEDISEAKAHEEKMKYMALHDPLTDIPNRRFLSQRLELDLAYCQRENRLLAVMIIDLDKFKPVNDCFGHCIGDIVLTQVAKRLEQSINRKTDTVARLGGDEFIIILPSLNSIDGAKAVASNICNKLNEDFMIKSYKIKISASIGISIYPHHGKKEISLMKHADKALYKAKKRGSNCFKIYSLEDKD